MRNREKGKKSLRMELIAMMVISCFGSMLILGTVIILVFVSSFSRQAVSDIQFYLENTNKTMNNHMQFLEDMITAFRHNDALQTFLEENGYRKDRVQQQFDYSAGLFSDRNMVDSQYPFVVILFLLLFFVTIITYFVSYRFTSPLKTISENIKLFGSGELDTRLKEFDGQELDDIRVVFNRMAESLEHLIKQVYEAKLYASQSQIRYLQAQINPHFMFNIVSMISMKAGIAGNTEVQNLLMAFARLLQGKIFRDGKIMIPLSEELKVVDFYLYLQSNRFADKLSYRIICEDSSLLSVEIPRLCIEPVVENAASHGLEPKPGKGQISITVTARQEMLHIVVEDDGVGFNTADMENEGPEPDEQHTHIGIVSTKQLLRNLYNGKADLSIESSPGSGTRVTIELPMKGWEKNVEGYDS